MTSNAEEIEGWQNPQLIQPVRPSAKKKDNANRKANNIRKLSIQRHTKWFLKEKEGDFGIFQEQTGQDDEDIRYTRTNTYTQNTDNNTQIKKQQNTDNNTQIKKQQNINIEVNTLTRTIKQTHARLLS